MTVDAKPATATAPRASGMRGPGAWIPIHAAPPARPAPVRRPGRPLIVVGCSAGKADAAWSWASEIYTGSFHHACVRAARVLAGPDGDVMVLSALYGLIPLSCALVPYERRLTAATATPLKAKVAVQARRIGLDRPVTVLTGRAYAEVIRSVWPTADLPLAGCTRGIGDMLHELKRMAGAA